MAIQPTRHHNEMSEALQELLVCLGEECAEAAQEAFKALRHGLEGENPLDGSTPRERLATELGQVLALVELALYNGVLYQHALQHARDEKYRSMRPWLHHLAVPRRDQLAGRHRVEVGGGSESPPVIDLLRSQVEALVLRVVVDCGKSPRPTESVTTYVERVAREFMREALL